MKGPLEMNGMDWWKGVEIWTESLIWYVVMVLIILEGHNSYNGDSPQH